MDGAAIPADDPPAQGDAMTDEDKARLDAAEAIATTEKTRADAAEAKATEEAARADRAEAERDAARAEVEKVRADALARARARVELEGQARSVLGAAFVCDGKTDRELRADALAKLGMTVAADRSDDYVIARFDAAIEAAAAGQSASRVIAAAMNSAPAAALPALDANTMTRSLWAGK